MADLSVPGVLRQAADVVDERGLARYAWSDPDGRVCALGAVAVACNLDPSIWQDSTARRQDGARIAEEAAEALSDFVQAERGNPPWAYDPAAVVVPWSDLADAATVAEAMRAAAKEAETA